MVHREADLRERVTVDRARTAPADRLVVAIAALPRERATADRVLMGRDVRLKGVTAAAGRTGVTVQEIRKLVLAVRNVPLPMRSVAVARKEMIAETEATIQLRNANANSGIHRT